MDKTLNLEADVAGIMRDWMGDLHRSGRRFGSETHKEVELIARCVVGAGGSLGDAFDAARTIIRDPPISDRRLRA